MRLLARLLEPKTTAHAHCDLPCGVYDPAQARIEAESVKAICEKYAQNTDPGFRARALLIKEQRCGDGNIAMTMAPASSASTPRACQRITHTSSS